MKVLLTGSTGILGSDIHDQLTGAGYETLAFNSKNIAIGCFSDVKAKVYDYRPDVIIHSAAMTNVDLCEVDRDAAFLTNVVGTQNLSRAAAAVNAKIVYISSCGVYGNGKAGPYIESDRTSPVNYHHHTKLLGEGMVREYNNDFLILRPGWLFGGTVAHRKNFVEARRKEALAANSMKSASDKSGSPTYTLDLAKLIIDLLKADLRGTFNTVNKGCASRYDYVKEIVMRSGFSTRVEPAQSSSFPRKAEMPDNECLRNLNLEIHNLNNMRDWKIALADYITNTYGI